jgi:short-subunit dehydrogenase
MRNLGKSSKIIDIAQEDNLPLEVLRLDVTDDKSVKDVINTIAVKQKRIHVVVNNAGYGSTGAVEEGFNLECQFACKNMVLVICICRP